MLKKKGSSKKDEHQDYNSVNQVRPEMSLQLLNLAETKDYESKIWLTKVELELRSSVRKKSSSSSIIPHMISRPKRCGKIINIVILTVQKILASYE